MKFFLYFLAFVVFAAAGLVAFVVYAVVDEARVSDAYRLFPAIVRRAMVDQGRDLTFLGDTEAGRQISATLGRDTHDAVQSGDDHTLGCDLPIDLSRSGIDHSLDAYSVLLSRAWTLRFAVFFYGEVPDVAPYLDPSQRDAELSPSDGGVSGNTRVSALMREDLRPVFRSLFPGTGAGATWRSLQCDRFSAIIFEER